MEVRKRHVAIVGGVSGSDSATGDHLPSPPPATLLLDSKRVKTHNKKCCVCELLGVASFTLPLCISHVYVCVYIYSCMQK